MSAGGEQASDSIAIPALFPSLFPVVILSDDKSRKGLKEV